MGLAASTKEMLGKDPRSGALFIFVNKAGDRLKALWWDRTGYCLLYKRLERGVFRFPSAMRPGDTNVAIDATELGKILEGLDVARMKDPGGAGIVHRKRTAESAAPPISRSGDDRDLLTTHG
jgi:transposase